MGASPSALAAACPGSSKKSSPPGTPVPACQVYPCRTEEEVDDLVQRMSSFTRNKHQAICTIRVKPTSLIPLETSCLNANPGGPRVPTQPYSISSNPDDHVLSCARSVGSPRSTLEDLPATWSRGPVRRDTGSQPRPSSAKPKELEKKRSGQPCLNREVVENIGQIKPV